MAIESSKNAGLRPQIYTHPLGLYGHSAGTTFGMWDAQDGIPGSGEHPLYENTTYAIELNAKVFIEQWEKRCKNYVRGTRLFWPGRISLH